MSDHVSPSKRSEIMRTVRTRDTSVELIVRRLLHSKGYRYRLHRRDLPGSPDLVFPGLRKVLFVHGCFWHGHNCNKGRLPKSKPEYWAPKIDANRERDGRAIEALKELGWGVETVWQCELRDRRAISAKLDKFLSPTSICV